MADQTPPPTVAALPDVDASPTDPKKQKLVHVNLTDPSTSASATPMTTISTDQENSTVSSGSGERPVYNDAMDGSTSPVVMAVPLPTDEGLYEKEEWWELRMTWSGKVYNMTVGGNDM
jgi:ubiquitin-like domain-containing CTD phosphatase 1